YLERIFENVDRNVIAVVSVEIISVGVRRMRSFENDLEITVTRAIDIALSRPPLERLLVVRPCGAPVHLAAEVPEEVAERFMGFGPYQIAISLVLNNANQFFELFLGLLVDRRVGGLRCCLRAPGTVGETKLDPARFGGSQFALVDFRVEFVGASVGPLRVLSLRLVFQLGIVGLLSQRVEEQEAKAADGKNDSLHGGNGTDEVEETCATSSTIWNSCCAFCGY